MKLTEKQRRFCDYYIETGNATESAIKAGYSKRTAKETGYENLTKPHLKSYIDEQLDKMHSERVADGQEVLEFLTSVMRGELKEETLIGLGEGEQGITEIDISANGRIKAAELIGKRHSLFTDKVELEAEVALEVVVDYGDD